MYEGPLSTRDDLVNRIDAGPLLDYLSRHGVIDDNVVEELNNESCTTVINSSLLEHVENQGKTGVGLFVNALRQTGQHQLASLLDDEEQRIKPLSGSGYLTTSRHKGQISLTVKVHAVQLLEGVLPGWKPSKGIGQKLWLSLDDIQLQICNTGSRFESDLTLTNKMQNFEIAEPEQEQERGGCCGCFRRLFSRKKKKPQVESGSGQHPHIESGYASTDSDHRDHHSPEFSSLNRVKEVSLSRTASERCAARNNLDGNVPDVLRNPRLQHRASDYIPSSMKVTHYKDIQEKLQNLKNAADTFKKKSEDFYEALQDTAGVPFNRMVKYFEQDRGILVLETHPNDGLVVVTICMMRDQLDELERDLDNGKLVKDIENCTLTDDILRKVDAEGVKLQIFAEREEFLHAKSELV